MKIDYIECGDSVEKIKTLPDNSIDLTVTSPPYDNLRTYGGFSWDFETTALEKAFENALENKCRIRKVKVKVCGRSKVDKNSHRCIR